MDEAAWAAHGFTDAWGSAALLGAPSWSMCPTCGAWAALALWESHLFLGRRRIPEGGRGATGRHASGAGRCRDSEEEYGRSREEEWKSALTMPAGRHPEVGACHAYMPAPRPRTPGTLSSLHEAFALLRGAAVFFEGESLPRSAYSCSPCCGAGVVGVRVGVCGGRGGGRDLAESWRSTRS